MLLHHFTSAVRAANVLKHLICHVACSNHS